jgi:hypothetical protein
MGSNRVCRVTENPILITNALGKPGVNDFFSDHSVRFHRGSSGWRACSGPAPQFCVTLMATNSLSGVTLPEMVAVTVTWPPDGVP